MGERSQECEQDRDGDCELKSHQFRQRGISPKSSIEPSERENDRSYSHTQERIRDRSRKRFLVWREVVANREGYKRR